MIRKEITITNPEGLSSHAAAALVQTACRYESRILLAQGQKTINAKSMMGVLSLGVGLGAQLMMIVDGKDEADACTTILHLIESNFAR